MLSLHADIEAAVAARFDTTDNRATGVRLMYGPPAYRPKKRPFASRFVSSYLGYVRTGCSPWMAVRYALFVAKM